MVLYDEEGNFLVGGQLPLATRKGQTIPNDRRMERHPAAMQAARDMFLKAHPTLRVRSLSAVYNCMGMIFASRRTYVEPEHLQRILEDDEYQRIPSRDEALPGDVVVYRNEQGTVVHVGVVAQMITNLREGTREVEVLSQWGGDGEYFHRADDVHPQLGSPSEYWSDRK
jgi:hypothetical protein